MITAKEYLPEKTRSQTSIAYNNIFHSVPLNTADIQQKLLNIETKKRCNIFPWNGQFSPQLIEILLSTYASKASIILDPFLGSGTILYEAGLLNLEAFGTEINPAAYKLARTYRLINYNKIERQKIIKSLELILNKTLESYTLMRIQCSHQTLKASLIDALKLTQGVAERELFEALIILLDFYRRDLTIKKIFATYEKLKNIVIYLPYSEHKINAFNRDARDIPFEDNSIDLVITSPPYINVFNYHQNYRESVEALGWDVLSVAKSEFGSNRKNRGNRFLTVIEYCIDIAQSLAELSRLVRTNGRIIFIVGRESNVRMTPFYNGQIIAALGAQCIGLRVDKRQERAFKNKFGQTICEDIIHFVSQPNRVGKQEAIEDAKKIARETLLTALQYAPVTSISDIEIAITKIDEIKPSPIYLPSTNLIFEH
ncbi:MAG: hypothetical protein HY754_00395 [Nitrospirae bacterium]|nr:hypothetical protein [Nitrospirota bacterium]